jgi:phosphoglycolate phosphatase-like HAD superfamily hydrolase
MLRRLILWDIDGTLLTAGSSGRLALERGAAVAAGLDRVPHVVMGGKTDPQIVRDILTLAGVPAAEIDAAMPRALAEAERFLAGEADAMRAEGRVHPGVRELLDELGTTDGVRQTVLTGNIAPNAVLKARTFDLDRHLDFEIGAYGTDHEERDQLVPVALRRARELRGEEYTADEVWVVGDTANDARCARAGGVRCLVVGTGHAGFGAVAGVEADALLENLADTAQVRKILLG